MMSKNFFYHEAFPLDDIDIADKRYMSRVDMTRWKEQVQLLKTDIAQRGQLDPVGVGQLEHEEKYIIIYGFTRTEAIKQLGWTTIRANVYKDLSEFDASILNATNNSTHSQLTEWERALQLQKLKDSGVKVDSTDPSEDTITKIFNMSRRNVFNWLKVVDYNCPELHQAIALDKIGLKHALLFIEYPQSITVSMLERCIEEEWSSNVLELKLKSATLHSEQNDENESKFVSGNSATVALDDELSTIRENNSATLHAKIKLNLDKAAHMMLACTAEDILSLNDATKQKLNDGIRMILATLLTTTGRKVT
jgi:ParB/RepB/Spo0J family partition protein